MIRLLCSLLLISSLEAAEFFSGQAARAVLGQSSFSSRDAGVVPSAMLVVNTHLFVADTANRVLTFDLTKIPGPKDDPGARNASAACALCGFAPVASVAQAVAPGSSAVSAHGKALASIDRRTHHVLLWYHVTAATTVRSPDVVLSTARSEPAVPSDSTLVDPVSVLLDGTRLFVGDAALHRVLVWKSFPVKDNQPADAVLGQRDFASNSVADPPRADSIARPDALASDGTNLYVGDSRDRRILVFTPADLSLPADAILNSASLSPGPLAPGTLVTVAGFALADRSASAPDDLPDALPTKLAGVQVIFNGATLPLLSVSPAEVRAQLLYATGGTASGNFYLRIEHLDGSVIVSAPAALTLTAASPGLFAFSGKEPRPGMLLHSDASPVSEESPALGGESATVWVTGLHIASAPDQVPAAGVPYAGPELAFTPIRAFVNGQPVEVLDAALPATSIGVYQVRVALPSNTGSMAAAQLVLSQDGYSSNAVTFPVQKARR